VIVPRPPRLAVARRAGIAADRRDVKTMLLTALVLFTTGITVTAASFVIARQRVWSPARRTRYVRWANRAFLIVGLLLTVAGALLLLLTALQWLLIRVLPHG
jgi:hypothetical protein